MKNILIASVALISAINVYANPWVDSHSEAAGKIKSAAELMKEAFTMDPVSVGMACKKTLLEEYGHLSTPEKAEILAGLMCSASSDKNLVELLNKAATKVE